MEAFTFALGIALRLALPMGLLFAFSHYLRAWDAHRVL